MGNKLSGSLGQLQGQFNYEWRFLFFSCACCVLAAGVISVFDLFLNLDWFEMTFVTELYVTVMGAMLFIIDFPVLNNQFDVLRKIIAKYFYFLTLFVGRGITYLFLSTMAYAALHDNGINASLGVLLGGYIFFCSCASIYIGVTRTRYLTSFKAALASQHDALSHIMPQDNIPVRGFVELAQ